MSNRLQKLVSLAAIPQVSSGTVPAAERRVVGGTKPAAVAEDRFFQSDSMIQERLQVALLIKILTAGAHATFTSTIEGSFDGATWFGLQFSIAPLTGLTIDANGVTFSAAIGLSGVALKCLGGFNFYRVGLAGDNVAANGTAIFGLLATREV